MNTEQHPYNTWIDLVSRRLGGKTLDCSDDFFADMENLLKAEAPIYLDGEYTERGKWMDGWESRRKRVTGNDWCIVKLGAQGVIHGVNVCTRFFAGNAPQTVSIEACQLQGAPLEDSRWVTILEPVEVKPDSDNFFDIASEQEWTHLRLNIFPDGGVARLRVYGAPSLNWEWFLPNEPIDLAYIKNGARPLACSDMFFSSMENLIMPDRGKNMGDGWETKRRRGGRECDWIIIKLGAIGSIEKVIVDTAHFKGNHPDSFTLEGVLLGPNENPNDVTGWKTVIDRQKLSADAEHFYREEVQLQGELYSHIRLNIFPDGGVSRLRVFGYPQKQMP